MGLCASTDAALLEGAKASKEIEKVLLAQADYNAAVIKLLLLGAGDSGKSTILKQFKLIHTSGFEPEEIDHFRGVIHRNLLKGIQVLLQGTRDLHDLTGDIDFTSERAAIFVADYSADGAFTSEVCDHVVTLWKDPAIQLAMRHEGRLPLEGSLEYYMPLFNEIRLPGWKPSVQDILQARVRTTGVVHLDFAMDGLNFRCVDVGGQRNERKKWISHFDNVNAIMFLASLSEYDKVLLEDGVTNRMHEATDLFEEICRCPYFDKTSILLFLNKRDLFEQKCTRVNLNVCFKDYRGGLNYPAALAHIQGKYEAILKTFHSGKSVCGDGPLAERELYTHITCATDTNNVRFVFDSAKHIILRSALNSSGIMM